MSRFVQVKHHEEVNPKFRWLEDNNIAEGAPPPLGLQKEGAPPPPGLQKEDNGRDEEVRVLQWLALVSEPKRPLVATLHYNWGRRFVVRGHRLHREVRSPHTAWRNSVGAREISAAALREQRRTVRSEAARSHTPFSHRWTHRSHTLLTQVDTPDLSHLSHTGGHA